MEMDTGMSAEQRSTMGGHLAKLLADTYLLYTKTQNFHWNIHGPEFYALHLLSEKQYEELGEAVDEIAERIRQLGFYVDATLSGFTKLGSVKENHKVHPKFESIMQLIEAQEVVIKELRKVGNVGEEMHDHATVDMVGRRLNVHEKALWMLRASL